MKTGRNDPCPCGSGKKYKNCCLQKQNSEASPQDLAWRRIRREHEGLPGRMLNFAEEVYGFEAIDEAWREFMLWDENEPAFDPETPHMTVFMPWFLHCWSPDPQDTEVVDASLHGVTPTRAYLERKGRHLTPAVGTYLQSCLDHPLSFFEVEHVEPGHGMALCDLLTGERHAVHEATASRSLQLRDIIFGQLACVDGVTMLEAVCSIALKPSDKIEVIELRKDLRGGKDASSEHDKYADTTSVWDWEPEIRELYLSLSEQRLYPMTPTLVTSDGETMEFHKLVYAIDSPQTAFDALRHLHAWPGDPEALEARVERDTAGGVVRATIDVARPGQDRQAESVSLLGTMNIEGKRLVAEVSSRERAERFKQIIAEALGAHASLRADKIQTIDQALAEARSHPPRSPQKPPDDPEAQSMLTEYLERHYTNWLDMPLPILGERTPREVATDADGREQVAAMLYEAEHHDIGLPASTRKAIFDSIRKQLQLAD